MCVSKTGGFIYTVAIFHYRFSTSLYGHNTVEICARFYTSIYGYCSVELHIALYICVGHSTLEQH